MRLMPIGVLLVLLVAAGACIAANPHDTYANWLPSGKLIIGDPVSEVAYEYTRDGAKEEFSVQPRCTRFGVLDVNLVVVVERACPGDTPVSISIDGKDAGAGSIGEREKVLVYVAPRDLTRDDDGDAIPDKIRIALTTSTDYASRPATIRMYMTRDWVVLGKDYEGVQPASGLNGDVSANAYVEGLLDEFGGDFGGARRLYKVAIERAGYRSKLPELAALRMRYCDVVQRARGIGHAKSSVHYKIGQLCMSQGFYELAVEQLLLATEKDPTNAEAWYLLADALGYTYGEFGDDIAQMIPCFEKAAAAYGREPNVWDVYVGIYTKIVVPETGPGAESVDRALWKVMDMFPPSVDDFKRNWEWMSTIVWAASRGSLKLNTHYEVVDEEVYVNDDEGYFDTLFMPGDYDVFVKCYEGGGSGGARGMDCGPNHTAIVEIDPACDWQSCLNGFTNAIDWAMTAAEVGAGVPATSGSDAPDWCGWQPIPSIGCGYRSLDHYYITPGMFEIIQGAQNPTSAFIQEWLVSGPYSCRPREGLDVKYLRQEGQVPPSATMKESGLWKLKASLEPWVDLSGLAREAEGRVGRPMDAAVAYAHVYVRVPKTQKVRMWLGVNDAARVWINRDLVHKGTYTAINNWNEADEPDQLCCSVTLNEGWNNVLVKVENYPKTKEELAAVNAEKNGWGFSLRFTDVTDRPVEGIATQVLTPSDYDARRAPRTGEFNYFNWWAVRDDYTYKLPQLTVADIRRLTKVQKIEITGDSVIRVSPPGRELQVDMGMPVRYYYDPEDTNLDNELNWRRENMAVVRYPIYKKPTPASEVAREWHDLIFLRPEAYDLYLSMMRLPADAGNKYGIRSHADRVVGYILVESDDHPNGRAMLVVDTYLGETLPRFEADLIDINRAWSE